MFSVPTTELRATRGSLAKDFAALILAWIFVLFLSGAEQYTWLYTPDSEFYITLSAFGEHITDRAPTDAYYWTKLGIIAPKYVVSHFFGFDVAHAVYRAGLLLLIMASAYAVARVRASPLVAVVSALFLGLNTVILGFVGDTYMTGAGLAAIAVVFALLHRWPLTDGWTRTAVSGLVGGTFAWLLMIHPFFVIIAASAATAFTVGNLVVRTRMTINRSLVEGLAVLAGFWVMFTTFIFAGTIVFPDLGWVDTVLFWSKRIEGSAYASADLSWLSTETSLLVPAIAVSIGLALWALSRSGEVGVFAVTTTVPVVLLAGYSLLTGGPALEASFFNACLWPTSLLGLVAVLTSLGGSQPLPVWGLLLSAGAPLVWILLGHWAGSLSVAQAAVLSLAATVGTVVIAWPLARHSRLRSTAGAATRVLLMIGLLGSAFQVLQNGRPLSGVGQIPRKSYSDAYVASAAAATVDLDLAVQAWVLGNTRADERVMVWDEPGGALTSAAAMALWGPNSVSQGFELGEAEKANLKAVDPDVVVLYADSWADLDRLSEELARLEPVTEPYCQEFPPVAAGRAQVEVGEVVVCLVRPGSSGSNN